MITDLFAWLEVVTGGDKLLMGFISAPIVAGLTGLVGYVLTKLPTIVKNFFYAQCVTSLTVHNGDYHKRTVFNSVTSYIYKNCSSRGSRTLSIDAWYDYTAGTHHSAMGIGLGRHYFFYRGRLMWAQRVQLEGQGVEMVEQITVSTIGRSHKIFHTLLKENTPVDDSGRVPIYVYGTDGWVIESKIVAGGLDTLALEQTTYDFFKNEISYFKSSREGYLRIGLPYKATFLLHGLPGTGKTSIIRALAAEFNLGICLLNLNVMSDDSLAKAFAKLPKGCILAIEDCDTSSATKRRGDIQSMKARKEEKDKVVKPKGSEGDNLENMLADAMGVSLSGLLNALDGVCSLDDVLVFMTTNFPERLDDAIKRPGRVDYNIELPVLSGGTVKRHFESIYPEIEFSDCPELLACEVNEIKNIAKLDGESAKTELSLRYISKNRSMKAA